MIDFLDPIQPSGNRDADLAELQTRVETRSRALEAEFAPTANPSQVPSGHSVICA